MPGTIERADNAGGVGSVLASVGTALRPELSELTAYVPGDRPGIAVRLDANEAPPVSTAVREVVMRALGSVSLERYPDPRALRLKEAIAKRTGAKAEELLLGTGSDEVIALLTNALAWPRRRNTQGVVLSPIPTFVMYRITSRAHGLKPVEVPLDAAWDLDVAMMTRAIALMQPSIVFIASPNNPTGNCMSADRLEEIVKAAGGDPGALVVIDEAYIDYAGPDASLRAWRARHPHVGILRTLSKVGLAALRVGWIEADAQLVAEVDKARQPFNVSATSQAAAAAVLEEAWDEVQAGVAHIVASRTKLAAAIDALDGFSVTPSAANFLWVKTPGSAEKAFEHLASDGILVRSFHDCGGRLSRQLRITVGTEAQHERLLASLARLPSERG